MYHLHVRRVVRGAAKSAMSRVDYVRRHGAYAKRGDVVRLVVNGGMPDWAAGDINIYWRALDQEVMRVNGRLLYTIEAAIPRALSIEQQNRLALRFVRYVARMSARRPRRGILPHLLAIHEGVRRGDALSGRLPNPHFHALISVSVNDAIARQMHVWFRRADPVNPALGGAYRSTFIGQIRWLYRVREAWARMGNAALRAAGKVADLDHRSHRTRGLEKLPTRHLGPRAAALARAGKPNAAARRNANIQRINAEVEAAGVARRAEASRLIEMTKLKEAEDAHLKEEAQRVRQTVHELLEATELAQGSESIVENAAVLLLCRDRSHPALDIQGVAMDGLLAGVLRALGPGWSEQRVGDRRWLICPDKEALVVIGPGFVATEDLASAGDLARVARALGFTNVVGFVNPDQRQEAMELLEAEPAFLDLSCEWRERASAARGPRLRP